MIDTARIDEEMLRLKNFINLNNEAEDPKDLSLSRETLQQIAKSLMALEKENRFFSLVLKFQSAYMDEALKDKRDDIDEEGIFLMIQTIIGWDDIKPYLILLVERAINGEQAKELGEGA